MGYIKKLKNNELVGGTDKVTIYPVTSTEAVFEEITEGSESNFKSQKFLNNNITGDRINEGTITDYNIAKGTITKEKLTPQVQTMLDEGQKKVVTPKGNYNPEEVYEALDLVFDPTTNSSYVSLVTPNTYPVDENAEGYEEGKWDKVLDGTAVNTALAAINTKVGELDTQVNDAITQAEGQVDTKLNQLNGQVTDAIGQANQEIQDLIDASEQALINATNEANDAAEEARDAASTVETLTSQQVADAQIGYFTCTNTAASGASENETKITTTDAIGESHYVKTIGSHVKVKMAAANTHAAPVYLQFGSNTATRSQVYYNGAAVGASNSWENDEVISVYYDGTYYQASNVQGGGGSRDGAFDISKYKTVGSVVPAYRTLEEALGTNGANVPENKRKGGMSVKYIRLTEATYNITKTEGIETQPTGTEIQEAISIADGDYSESDLSSIETLPATLGSNVVYYLAVTEEIEVEPETEGDEPTTETVTTYTVWTITKLTNEIKEYVQWTLKNTAWSLLKNDWVGKDNFITPHSPNLVTSGAIYEQTSKIDKLLESAFNIEVIDVESYTLNTASRGSSSRYVYGNVLTNDYAFDLKTIKLYCSTATSSFVIAIGEVDTEQSKYVINKSYRINKALTVGENVIDVSKYDIVIPPYALVACTGTTTYTAKGGNKMIGVISTNEGASGTYTSIINNSYMQFVLLGTITKYHSKDGIFDTGELVSGVKIKNDFSGGKSDVLSAEQGKKLNTQITDLVSYSFNTETINVETPQVSTETAGAGLSGTYWGTVLTNDTTIVLQSVRFYSDRALSSFKIAIGSANIEENTYHIDNCYTIQAGVSVGENTIDVSEYDITIPPKALAVCTAVFHYKTTSQGCYLIGRLSIDVGTDGSYTTKYNASSTCAYIGIAKHYDIVIPESVLEILGRSNILFGKKYTAIGDSFTFRNAAYPHIIGNRNNMSVLNQGASGSTLNGYITQGRYSQIPQDVDYVTIWYGINDSGHHIDVGTVNDQPETITSETGTTTCGGYNWIFKWLLTNRPFAHIGVIITDYCSQTRREAIMACCQKWGIAYLDLYNPTIPMIRTRGTTQYTHDVSIAPLGYVEVCDEAKALRNTVFSTDPATTNMHPNDACHLWQSNLIENFMRGL